MFLGNKFFNISGTPEFPLATQEKEKRSFGANFYYIMRYNGQINFRHRYHNCLGIYRRPMPPAITTVG